MENTVAVQRTESQQIVEDARRCVEQVDDGKWKLGAYAVQWVERSGETLEKLAEAIDVELDSLQRYAHVWQTFGGVADSYPRLHWSHFRAATGWPDSSDWLASANENQWSVAVMKRMRSAMGRADRGEDLREGEAVMVDGSGTEAAPPLESVPPMEPVERDPAETAQKPEKPSTGGVPRDRTHQAPEKSPSAEKAEATIRQQLTAATKLARAVDPRFAFILADQYDRLAECLRQGETGEKVVGLENDVIKALIKRASDE